MSDMLVGQSFTPASRVVLIDSITGEPVPFLSQANMLYIQAELDSVETTLSTLLNTTLPSLQTRLTAAENSLLLDNAVITGIQVDLDAIELTVNTINNSVLPSISSNLVTLSNTTVPALQTQLNAATSSLATLTNTTIPSLQTQLNAATSSLATLTNTTVPGLQTQITTNTSSLATLTNTTVPGLQTQISALGGTSSIWQVQSTDFTAVAGSKYHIDTTAADVMVTLPGSPASGTEIAIVKYSASNKIRLTNLSKINNGTLTNEFVYITGISTKPTILIYINNTIGWLAYTSTDISLVTPVHAYVTLIQNNTPFSYLRLNETSGVIATAQYGANGTISGTPTFQSAGLLYNSTDKAITFNSSSSTQIYLGASAASAPSVYTLECIFKVNSGSYGGLFSFGNSTNQASSSSYDRELYIRPDGKLEFYVSAPTTTHTTTSVVNNGSSHIVTLVQHSGGIEIWLDKTLIYTHSEASAAAYSGYWHIGYARGFNTSPGYLNGVIDEASMTHSRVSQANIQSRHAAALNI